MSHAFALLFTAVVTFFPVTELGIAPTNPTGACPLEAWRGGCRRLADIERDRIRRALEAHVPSARLMCVRARTAMLRMLNTRSELWVFNAHVGDNAAIGTYVLAETAVSDHPPVSHGTGFRRIVLSWSGPELALVALHEGAHLAGGDEQAARDVEALCLLSQR